jgi:hypothetical protein
MLFLANLTSRRLDRFIFVSAIAFDEPVQCSTEQEVVGSLSLRLDRLCAVTTLYNTV